MMSNLRCCPRGFGGTLFAARLLDVWPSRQCVDVREEEWHLASRMALSSPMAATALSLSPPSPS